MYNIYVSHIYIHTYSNEAGVWCVQRSAWCDWSYASHDLCCAYCVVHIMYCVLCGVHCVVRA